MIKGLLSEALKIVSGIKPDADRFNGDPVSDYFNMGLYGLALGILDIGVGATGTATITVLAGADASGTDAEAIPFKYRRVASGDTAGAITDATVAGFTTTAGGGEMYLIEIDAADCPAGKPYCAIKATEVADDPVDAALAVVLGNARYSGATLPSAIA